jgi:hypothetical protein
MLHFSLQSCINVTVMSPCILVFTKILLKMTGHNRDSRVTNGPNKLMDLNCIISIYQIKRNESKSHKVQDVLR